MPDGMLFPNGCYNLIPILSFFFVNTASVPQLITYRQQTVDSIDAILSHLANGGIVPPIYNLTSGDVGTSNFRPVAVSPPGQGQIQMVNAYPNAFMNLDDTSAACYIKTPASPYYWATRESGNNIVDYQFSDGGVVATVALQNTPPNPNCFCDNIGFGGFCSQCCSWGCLVYIISYTRTVSYFPNIDLTPCFPNFNAVQCTELYQSILYQLTLFTIPPQYNSVLIQLFDLVRIIDAADI
jgi:hypothetical protein